MRRFLAFLSCSMIALACGDAPPPATDDAGADAGAPDVFAPAAHPPAPTLTDSGGPVLASPKVVVVTFGDDPLAPSIESFAASVGASSYWSATTSEYGVGALGYGGAVHLAAPPAATLSTTDLESWIASELDGTHPEWPAYDPSTIYTIVMPAGGGGIEVDGVPPCKSSPAYHFEIDSGSRKIVYAAINRCDPLMGLKGIDYVTAGLSHEWIEASTDPYYVSAPAYEGPPPRYDDWNLVTGGELADFCTILGDVYFEPADLPFTVQRSWSNAAASAGHDPCVPAAGGAYFAAAPELSGTLIAKYQGATFSCEGAHVAMGAQVDVPVHVFSDAPMDAPVAVSARALLGANLAFAWDRTSGANGDVLTLTVTRNGDGSALSGADLFEILASSGGRESIWIGAVGK